MDNRHENLGKYIWGGSGCPDFPPPQKVFQDRGENYFVSILMPGGEARGWETLKSEHM